MICVDQNGQAVEISVADQMWLDDAYFKEKQMRLEPNAPRAALAYRVSTKGQVDHDDIPMQKIDCRKFAQKQGWRVVKEVAEKGVSGSKVSASKRDAIQQLKEEAANGEFDILLVYMFDRLGRIESETPFVLEWFVQHGIQMWSTHEGQQKIETHGDKLMNYIRFWQAAGESEKTSIRTRDRIRQIVSSGHYTGGFVCYGYQLVDQGRRNKRDKPVMDLVINEEESTWGRFFRLPCCLPKADVVHPSAFGRQQGSRKKRLSEPATESDKLCPAVTTQVASYAMVINWWTKADETSVISLLWIWSSMRKNLHGFGNSFIRLSKKAPADMLWLKC